MATSRSLPDISEIQEITNSTEGFAPTKRSGSISCFSTDGSDDSNQQIQNEKRKLKKKKRFILFRKSHTERKDTKNTKVQQLPASQSIKQRLINFYHKKRKKKSYNISQFSTDDVHNTSFNQEVSHSQTEDANNADSNQEDSIGDLQTLNDEIAMQQNEEDNVETTERDSKKTFMTTGMFPDRPTETGHSDRRTQSRVICVKSQSSADDCIRTNPQAERYGLFDRQKNQLVDREEELARKEIELSKREDEISRRENNVLTNQQDSESTLHILSKTIENILLNPRYVEMSGCKNIQIGTGNIAVQQNLEQVHSMLEDVCVKYEDIKKTTETTLKSVRDLQHDSTDHNKQLQKIADFLESELRHHKSAEASHESPPMTENTPEQLCNHCNLAYRSPSGNIWGPSTVRNIIVSSHVRLEQNVNQILSDVQLIKSQCVSPPEGAKKVSSKD